MILFGVSVSPFARKTLALLESLLTQLSFAPLIAQERAVLGG